MKKYRYYLAILADEVRYGSVIDVCNALDDCYKLFRELVRKGAFSRKEIQRTYKYFLKIEHFGREPKSAIYQDDKGILIP